jgi:hypothetical protein
MKNQNEDSKDQETQKLSPEEFKQVVNAFVILADWRDRAIAAGAWNPKPPTDNSSDNKAE